MARARVAKKVKKVKKARSVSKSAGKGTRAASGEKGAPGKIAVKAVGSAPKTVAKRHPEKRTALTLS